MKPMILYLSSTRIFDLYGGILWGSEVVVGVMEASPSPLSFSALGEAPEGDGSSGRREVEVAIGGGAPGAEGGGGGGTEGGRTEFERKVAIDEVEDCRDRGCRFLMRSLLLIGSGCWGGMRKGEARGRKGLVIGSVIFREMALGGLGISLRRGRTGSGN